MVLRPIVKEVDTGIYVVAGTPFLYISPSRTLLMADLHLGFEEAASRGLIYSLRGSSGYGGIFIPRIQLKRVLQYLDQVSQVITIDKIVINGDLKHAFDRLLRQEREEVGELVKRIRDIGVKEVEVVRGNHDNFIKPVLKKLEVEFVDSIEVVVNNKKVLLVHGHEYVDTSGKDIVIIGHEHPSLRCFGAYRFPVFMKIPLETGGILIIMPATGPYHPGINASINREEYLSPIVRRHAILENASLITWLNLGSAEPITGQLLESIPTRGILDVDGFLLKNMEIAVLEFKDIEIAHVLCTPG
ncbi:metallophosphoesterase [Desulfurococcus amylolyticus]|uniref:metallophosphoesterase n=1 Tax=Desulfurococcus TaxID=2273 RepID=UPI0005B1D276|nr:metallophosphoesterase [Desulfurococcus amylolyticus]